MQIRDGVRRLQHMQDPSLCTRKKHCALYRLCRVPVRIVPQVAISREGIGAARRHGNCEPGGDQARRGGWLARGTGEALVMPRLWIAILLVCARMP